MCNTGFVVVPRTITQSAYSCLAATAVSSVVVETDIGSFIINTVTLACISLHSAVGSASGFWSEGRELESRWDSLLFFFCVPCLFWLKRGIRSANVPTAPRAGLRPAWTRFARCARPAAAQCYFGISAILTGNDASNRLNIIIFVISRSISVELDTSLALFQKF